LFDRQYDGPGEVGHRREEIRLVVEVVVEGPFAHLEAVDELVE
jgi:hypothetical protein